MSRGLVHQQGGVRVKICGITSPGDALAAVAAGADALGFVFYPRSPRFVTVEQVREITRLLPPFVTRVGLFVNEQRDLIENAVAACGLDRIQLHGDESPHACTGYSRPVIKALRVKDASILTGASRYMVASFLLDAYDPERFGGTGEAFDWDLARSFCEEHPVILAGGLNPENVRDAVKTLPVYAVDVSSGVEKEPGIKDHEKVRAFIARAKGQE